MYYNENRKSGENVERKLKTRHLYRHFKGKLYYVMNIGLDSETLEEVVIYQAMYDDKKIFIRSLEMFLSKVDIKKYPNVE